VALTWEGDEGIKARLQEATAKLKREKDSILRIFKNMFK
jgi:hypothetical protein